MVEYHLLPGVERHLSLGGKPAWEERSRRRFLAVGLVHGPVMDE
jgi:hypothetical protein